ncbi:assimilatory sulfite reductase (NADPH) hemoprotein subunit [Spectribacter hydrogenoxidans]|uniref:Sulfite reductase [NADPH] hemoprotein beta-component n=1 Tax=Spectribacter hydrogenoxidans TaxID=3075608 RepID=A0ABU3BY51_9GAMM|nr:assimilatory sulfite reductase (NADPH) hemoprotein subunit [Salinisphaera sp. W335]MDT0634241.1 assimilatory sulfite reductase (NADPH) hemoprotein subunit [Salinisphaera sp. W335]
MPEIQPDFNDVEHIKSRSNYLRGTIAESLADRATGAVADDDTQLTKFHGFYQQDDRDLRAERKQQKLEPHYQFMVRLRLPGGVLTASQWLALDEIARTYANGTLRVTTRQTFQYHGVFKEHLKPLLQAVDAAGLDAKGGCGDVNRNVVANTNPHRSRLHAEVHDWTHRVSEHLLWRSKAYEELWLDGESGGEPDHEPLYGSQYLPRKFKIAIAIPPENDSDVYANDLGFIAIADGDELLGFNVSVGGGMGATYGDPATYPRLGSVIGFCTPDQVLAVSEHVIGIQRDYGDRVNRKRARFKYTLDDNGLDWFRDELNNRLGFSLEAPREAIFTGNGDRFGWTQGDDGRWHLTLLIENGRIADFEHQQLMTGLRELAGVHRGEFRLTCNQNLIVANVEEADRPAVQTLVDQYNLDGGGSQTALRQAAMACVAFPTCGLAMAESERYLPGFIGKLDAVMADAGLDDKAIVIRMTGCPNGCARPYLGEIAFTGKAPGKYNLYLGASFTGDRLNKLYRENIGEDEIMAELVPMIHRYAAEREPGEHFGDFVVRVGIIHPTLEGRFFHEDVGDAA